MKAPDEGAHLSPPAPFSALQSQITVLPRPLLSGLPVGGVHDQRWTGQPAQVLLQRAGWPATNPYQHDRSSGGFVPATCTRSSPATPTGPLVLVQTKKSVWVMPDELKQIKAGGSRSMEGTSLNRAQFEQTEHQVFVEQQAAIEAQLPRPAAAPATGPPGWDVSACAAYGCLLSHPTANSCGRVGGRRRGGGKFGFARAVGI